MDPTSCTFDPGSIQCPAGATDTSTCLTAAQVETVRKLYSGPRDDHGDLLYPGWEVKGSEANWAPWLVPVAAGAPTSTTIDWNVALNTIRYLAYRDARPTLGLTDIPFTRAGFRQIMSQTGDVFDATDPDLTAFRDAGGKLVLWHGWADPAISPIGTVAYYQAVQDRMGGAAATARFARLFMLPGVGHCSGGQGPDSIDALSAVVDWVEHGKAPESFLTTRSSTSTSAVRSLPVYPYPMVATYDGSGDPGVASSYHPAPPAKPFDAHVDWLGSFSRQPHHD
jgi:feruloyl esterase